jgi:hypothetical protein
MTEMEQHLTERDEVRHTTAHISFFRRPACLEVQKRDGSDVIAKKQIISTEVMKRD